MSTIELDSSIDWVGFYAERLKDRPRLAGERKYHACCPFHKESNPSFWFNTENGLWKCEAGCGSGNPTTFLARLLGISTRDAWAKLTELADVKPEGGQKRRPLPRLPLTLAEYALAKRLDEEQLRAWGLVDHTDGAGTACIAIPYYDESGALTATKLRYHPDGQRFSYLPGGKTTLYGLWLKENRDAGALILVEGESDAQALWQMGLPAYGVPGAGNFRAAWAPLLRDRDVYLHLEPGQSGEVFKNRTMKALMEGGYRGSLRAFRASDIDEKAKDPSDLHVLLGDSASEAIKEALKGAEKIGLTAGLEVRDAMPILPPKKAVRKLETYSAAELYGKALEMPPVIVEGLIPAGLTVLAGAPKRGKSWLTLQLAVSVAAGVPFLGMATEQGDVLYLDLESRQYRVQSRLNALLPGRAPERLQIAHEADGLDGGLLTQLGDWCAEVSKPALIIIDTLGRVKGGGRRGENAYEGDTRIFGGLQKFAMRHGLGIVAVHHTRKSMPETDYFERVSGSMGLTGVCDEVIVLGGKRTEPDNVLLNASGRDFDPVEMVLGFDKGVWTLKSANSEAYQKERAYAEDPAVRAIIRLAEKQRHWEGSATELLAELMALTELPPDINASKLTRFTIIPHREMLHDRDGILINMRHSGMQKKRFIVIQKVSARESF